MSTSASPRSPRFASKCSPGSATCAGSTKKTGRGRSKHSGRRSPSIPRTPRAAPASRSCSRWPTRVAMRPKPCTRSTKRTATTIDCSRCSRSRPTQPTRPSQRLRLLEQATSVAETKQSNAARAFAYAVRGVREAAGEPEITAWLERAERLAHGHRSLRRAGEARARGSSQHPRRRRAAHHQPAHRRARSHQARRSRSRALVLPEGARSARRRPASALGARVALRRGARRPGSLEILKSRVDVGRERRREKAAALPPGQAVAPKPLGDQDAAIAVYETILDICARARGAPRAREALPSQASGGADLVALYERSSSRAAPTRPTCT